MTISVHTANLGWLQHPDVFAHIAAALNVQVLIQSDLALHDHEYRVYADTVPITKTIPIGEDCGKRIRNAIERHLANEPHEEPAQVDKLAPDDQPVAPAPAPAPAQLMQAKLF